MKEDALPLVKALRGFGVLERVLEQVQASLVPPKRDAGNDRERASSDCKAQLHSFRQRLAKQRKAVSNAQEDVDRSQEELTGLEDEVAKLDLRYRELSVDPLTPSSSKVASEVGDGPRLEKVQEEIQSSDDMDLTNKFVGPDSPELPAGSPPQRSDHLPPPAPSAAFVQNLDVSKRCRVAAAFSHDSVLTAAANKQIALRDGAQLIAGLCNFLWDGRPSQLRAS